MSKRIEKIVIVGGGTAGWMAAAFLNKVFGNATGRKISITVVESDDVGIIGVGEATIASIRKTLQVIGVPEWRIFKEADATFKNAIKFVNWTTIPENGKDTYYYHQFDPPHAGGGFEAMTHWLALKDAGVDVPPLADATSVQGIMCDFRLGPQTLNSEPYSSALPYAYHFDTVKVGRLFREIAMERGVKRIVDHVTNVNQHEDGDIASLDTRDGRKIEGDFFIDCSGFAALLIEKTLKEPFLDYSDRLLNDRAVAGQVMYPEGETPRPFTQANAKTAGWIWEIDLYHRTGAGYVYSSNHISDDEAEAEFRGHFGERGAAIDTRRLKMRIGRRENFWVKNCAAIGLSSGFIEPIESTGIHLAELGVVFLADYIGEGADAAPLRKQYNKIMRETYDEISDFIQMHYMFNRRHGQPFWDDYRNVKMSDTLAEQMEIWKRRMPTRGDLRSKINVFDGYNMFAVMGGVGCLPPNGNSHSPFIDLKKSAEVLAEVQQMRQRAIRTYPTHVELINKMRAMGDKA